MHLVLQWITEGITLAQQEELLSIAPPILSRCYQELSNGALGYNNAYKVVLRRSQIYGSGSSLALISVDMAGP